MQGIGQALMERTSYDSDGQLLSGSFMDYAMPQATDAPGFVFRSHPVPARTNALGAKGCGEAGCAGRVAGGDERPGRRARPAHRNAGDAGAGVGGVAERGVGLLRQLPHHPDQVGLTLKPDAGQVRHCDVAPPPPALPSGKPP